MSTRLVHSNKGTLIALVASNTNPYTSDAIAFRTEQIGVTVFTVSSVNGSLKIQAFLGEPEASGQDSVLEESNWYDLGSPRSIVANTLDFFTLNQGMVPLRAVFTPAGTPHTTRCILWGYGG